MSEATVEQPRTTAAPVGATKPEPSKSTSGSNAAKVAHSAKKKNTPSKKKGSANSSERKPGRKPYPVLEFSEALRLAQKMFELGSRDKIKRLTLLSAMNLEPTSEAARQLITNSNKYAITQGSHSAEEIRFSKDGLAAVSNEVAPEASAQARFRLAIQNIPVFNLLYEKFRGQPLPAPALMHDELTELDAGDRKPCTDIFISNAKFLKLVVERAGAEHLIVFDPTSGTPSPSVGAQTLVEGTGAVAGQAINYDRICFMISPIGDAGTDVRKHADVILAQYVERALEGTDLVLVRADRITESGMISRQIIEHIVRSKLVVADLSFHNPNVFYELCLRHVTGKPTVHLIKDDDRIPFDLANFRTIRVDTRCKYQMVTQLDSLRSEISNQIRQALQSGESRDNPILSFIPSARFNVG